VLAGCKDQQPVLISVPDRATGIAGTLSATERILLRELRRRIGRVGT
jgi:hypothetical protein